MTRPNALAAAPRFDNCTPDNPDPMYQCFDQGSDCLQTGFTYDSWTAACQANAQYDGCCIFGESQCEDADYDNCDGATSWTCGYEGSCAGGG